MTFDPDQFMNETYEEANDTKYVPVPEGEYPAIIEKVELKQVEGKDGKSFYPLEVTWNIQDQGVQDLLGQEVVRIRQSLYIDFNAAGTAMDFGKGKNIQLGKLREALGLNTAGQRFSLKSLEGQSAKVWVKQTPKKDDPETIYANVTKVAPLN